MTEEEADAEARRRNLEGQLPPKAYWIAVERPDDGWEVELRRPETAASKGFLQALAEALTHFPGRS